MMQDDRLKNRVSSIKLSRKDLKFKYKYSLKNGLKKLILWRISQLNNMI